MTQLYSGDRHRRGKPHLALIPCIAVLAVGCSGDSRPAAPESTTSIPAPQGGSEGSGTGLPEPQGTTGTDPAESTGTMPDADTGEAPPTQDDTGADSSTGDDDNDDDGPPTGEVPAPPEHEGTLEVTETIVIDEPGVYDFGKVLHIWKGPSHNCNGEQENGPQILRIEASDVTVRDFYFVGDGSSFDSNGLGDPVHIASCGSGQGNLCSEPAPQHVIIDGLFGHACEDLLTIGTPGTDDILVENSYLEATPSEDSWDKTIQINFGSDLKFHNNVFVGGARCIRFKPNTDGEVIGNQFYGCGTAVLASSDDADISPMTDGPTTVQYTGNWCFDCSNETDAKGDDVTFTE